MKPYRPPGALLAGVCAELARRLGWNAWALRALFLVGLFIKPIATALVYGVLALGMGLFLSGRGVRDEEGNALGSSELGKRGERIADLERRFRELERRHR